MNASAQRTKRRQLREETRQQILDAAQALPARALVPRPQRGLRDVGTGHTRTVFYRHFDDVPSLVLTLIAEIGGELVEVGEAWAHTGESSPAKAREQLARFVDFYVRNGSSSGR